MEIRGYQYAAVQGVATITNDTTDKTVIPGIPGKTLYLNYILLSLSDVVLNGLGELTDGDGGTVFWSNTIEVYGQYMPTSYMLNFGQYGFALTEGNGLFADTSSTAYDYTITALGYYK